MKVGLGLPGTDIDSLFEWARRADGGPFSTLGLFDRLVYDSPEPLVMLSALAVVTSRIRLQTEVLVAPIREPVLLAKQAATLDRLFPGRFTLGLGLGGRDDDYRVPGVDARGKGRRFEEQLGRMRDVWSGKPHGDQGDPVGPAPSRSGGPELLFGAFAPAAVRRAARYGDGVVWTGSPARAGESFRGIEAAWREAGRAEAPRLVAQVGAAIGSGEVIADARARISRYYAFLGEEGGAARAGEVLTDPGRIRDVVAELTEAGADEVVLYCWSPDLGQIDRLAAALF